MTQDFVHLRMHTEFSIKDGMLNPKKVVHKAIASGMKALAITDATAMFGDVIFYKAASAAGIKPILGADCSITNHYNRDDYLRLLFLARNHQGYLTLCDLLSRAWLTNQYKDRGEVDLDWITPEMADGLIVLSGFNTGAIGKAILNGDDDVADMVKILAKMFRNVLDSDKKNYTVNDELDNIRSYICLQNIRFDNVITLHEDVDQKLCQARIMPILFQPVIENSFKYGSRESGIPIKISISGRLVDEHIMVFTIQDDGAGMSGERLEEVRHSLEALSETSQSEETQNSHRIGLRNIAERIRLRYGNEGKLSILSSDEYGTVVEIRIPYMEQERG